MRAFLDRYLPASERRIALWCAFGGAALDLAVRVLYQSVHAAAGGQSTPMPTYGIEAIADVAVFSAVLLIVGVAVKFAKAPRAFALYVALAALASAAGTLIVWPLAKWVDTLLSSRAGALGYPNRAIGGEVARVVLKIATALGSACGALVGAVVSIARIRSTGFDGEGSADDASAVAPLPRGGAFLGWEPGPLQGDTLVVVSFAAATLVSAAFNGAVNSLLMLDSGQLSAIAAWIAMRALVYGALWAAVGAVSCARFGVRSAWVLPLGGWVVAVAVSAVLMLRAEGMRMPSELGWLAVGVVPVIAAWAGTALALRRQTVD